MQSPIATRSYGNKGHLSDQSNCFILQLDSEYKLGYVKCGSTTFKV